jgi:hypothetical protein
MNSSTCAVTENQNVNESFFMLKDTVLPVVENDFLLCYILLDPEKVETSLDHNLENLTMTQSYYPCIHSINKIIQEIICCSKSIRI